MRQVYRVALDFDWPLNKVWKGFINPFLPATCEHCSGTGTTAKYDFYCALWRGNVKYQPKTPYVLTERLKQNPNADHLLTSFNSAWKYHLDQQDVDDYLQSVFAKDLEGNYVITKSLVPPTVEQVIEYNMYDRGLEPYDLLNEKFKREGWQAKCEYCVDGNVWKSKEEQENYANWKETNPPTGDGYQLWEKVSSGSPISPVFENPEQLADYLITRNNGVFNHFTKDKWLDFICNVQWMPSYSPYSG